MRGRQGADGCGGEAELTRFRRGRVGFVFQQYNLLETLTVAQNTVLPLKLAGRRVDRRRAREVLTSVGLGTGSVTVPTSSPAVSGSGWRSRGRWSPNPRVIFADEPTGALDTRSARQVLLLLQEAVRVHGRTVVMVTHDPVAASYADSVVFLADGLAGGADGRADARTRSRSASRTWATTCRRGCERCSYWLSGRSGAVPDGSWRRCCPPSWGRPSS
ncbi:hypothetical protein SVIOM342S_07268 [Streptomyces violaceorubidus]